MKFLLGIMVSVNAFAAGFTGHFNALEVLPMDNTPLYELHVQYDISVKGDEVFEPERSGNTEIDGGFTPEQFHQHFFQSPQTDLLVSATAMRTKVISIIESATGPGIKEVLYEGTMVVVDPEKVNRALEEAIVINKKELRLDKGLTELPLVIKVCVSQPRRFGRQTRPIGCEITSKEELRNGKIQLKQIDFGQTRKERELFYYFHWSLEGLRLKGKTERIPMVKVSP